MFGFLQSREKFLASALIIVFFLLNLSIASRSPFGGWMDEVTYVDSGLNLAAGKGWTSSSFPWQTDREFCAVNSPLYPGALALWVKVFGISMVSARAYGYFLGAVGMSLLWAGTFRFNLLTPAYRLLWIVILSSEYAMNWMIRDERYDVWIFVGLALAWFGASLRHPGARYSLIFLGCLLIPFAGFVGAPYVFLAGCLAAGLTKFRRWREAVAGMAGAVSGVVGVWTFFAVFGSWGAFQHCVRLRTAAEQGSLKTALKIFIYPIDDPGVAIMIVLLAALSVYAWKYRPRGSFTWLGLGWGFVILMPFLMQLRGRFAMMYFYLLIIPLSLAILQLAHQTGLAARGRKLALAVTVIMAMLCLGGLPARLYTSWKYWDFRDPQHMRDFVRAYIHPGDSVYSDYAFYFVLRDQVKFVALPWYSAAIPPDEAAQVDVALMKDSDSPDLSRDISGIEKIGGGWRKVAVFPTAEMRSKLRVDPSPGTFTLYRRETASP